MAGARTNFWGRLLNISRSVSYTHLDVYKRQVTASIVGDAKTILRKLNARLDPVNHDEWIAHIERMKDMYPLRYDKRLLTGPYIIQTIDELTPDDAIIVTEVGQHQMWACLLYTSLFL